MEAFRVMLLKISNNLSKDNVDKLKFVCQDTVGKKNTEDIVSGIQLFDYLITRLKIGPDNTEFLRKLLTDIRQLDLLTIIDDYEDQYTPADPTDTAELGKIRTATDVIVEHLGRKWQQYGRKLGISDGKLENIEEKHPRNLEEKVREVIKEWKKMRKGQAKVEDLIKALRDCNQNYTADLVEKKLQKAITP